MIAASFLERLDRIFRPRIAQARLSFGVLAFASRIGENDFSLAPSKTELKDLYRFCEAEL